MKFIALLVTLLITATAFAGLDLNTASVKDLENLPGVGPTVAKEIVAKRPFKTVEDLKSVKGIGEAKFAKLKSLVEIAPVAAPAAVVAKVSTTATPAKAEMGKAAAAKQVRPVNINTASAAEIESLPGIGAVKAKAIVEARPFAKIEDLKKVKGIKEATLNKIKPLITLN